MNYLYRVGIFEIEVKILKERDNFKRIDCLITPVAGTGQKWIYKTRLKPINGEKKDESISNTQTVGQTQKVAKKNNLAFLT